jgi:hypothetical protein
MTDFIATLAAERTGNWDICKREHLWGVVGRGSNWKKNASQVRTGDRIFVWKSGPRNGFIAQMEARGPLTLVGEPGAVVPWPEPDWFGGVFPMRVVREVSNPLTDSFPNAQGRNGVRFGFNNTALQHIFEEISPSIAARIDEAFSAALPAAPAAANIGIPYVAAPPPMPVSPMQPFAVDPDLLDRGLAAHHATVAALAGWVRREGHSPLLPAPGDPWFDLAWFTDDVLNVAEVKSTTSANEENQLRLGLGQVIRYRQQLGADGREVVAWLVPERQPADATWTKACAEAGVRMWWPAP